MKGRKNENRKPKEGKIDERNTKLQKDRKQEIKAKRRSSYDLRDSMIENKDLKANRRKDDTKIGRLQYKTNEKIEFNKKLR
jgi:hypothetical protein